VAACADHHLVVAKRQTTVKGETGPRTESGVSVLDGDKREQEIARMLGGEHVSQTSLAHAREMLRGKAPETSS
jgi:DNA repair protein RecN (Recombination protein N)